MRHLRAALCQVTAGEIRPREHDQIRWLAPEGLDDVDWLEPDRPFIALLSGAGSGEASTLTFHAEYAPTSARATAPTRMINGFAKAQDTSQRIMNLPV